MIIKIYFFNFLLFWTIQFNTTSCRPANKGDYTKYLFEIVNYIRFQDKNTSMQHLTDGLMENFDSFQDLDLQLNDANFPRIFNAIIELLICRYIIVLKIFRENIGLIIHHCDNYHSKKQYYDFIYCIITLDDALESSRALFENLNNVMQFFSNLNIGLAFKKYETRQIFNDEQFKVINKLSFIVNYIQTKRKLDIHDYIDQNGNPQTIKAYNDFVSVKYFQNDLTPKIVFIIIKNNRYNTWQYKLEKNDIYVQEICNELKIFYNEAIYFEYVNLGFHNLLHPTTPRFIPPIYDVYSNDLGICVINTLFDEGFWELLIHTRIRVNNQTKDVNEIRHVTVDRFNFLGIKQDVILMLKCRYSALLKNVFASLGAMQYLCELEQKNFNNDNLITCVNTLKNTIPSVTTMLNSLLATLALLKKASIWDYKLTSQLCLIKVTEILTAYYHAFKNQNTSPIVESNELEAMQFLNNIQFTRSCLVNLLSNNKINQFLKNYCDFDQPILDKFELIKSYQYAPNYYIDSVYHGFVYQKVSSHLKQICEEFLKIDYDLGFNSYLFHPLIQHNNF
ncbi:uncharacterized protein LOC126898039 [Daktulosphaira vitifoliae]|uniref:uncharacterized protein LOC126898039 n=1 Tax=Daktulosphaira vitifoliae TaxID=58002 RepID=UPI0021A9ED90|nr:uncharacterized protein LOC126898039 [Daktulosphaira vitifoliae]